ncbi:hypothetical protein [Mucilaginibacter sp.]|uniref:hypothetical protein n=1 Tax=Mucilaginibacter sp. TaxID=1882438 RepID=UPI002841B9D1|nr:hypothetical protein [Mucilaginibacter sp.]MDR3693258.1 hypothetical protein [Mucilaginibacter sp.]
MKENYAVKKTIMATLIHHYYFSSEIIPKHWHNDPVSGIQTNISEDTFKCDYVQKILTSSDFWNMTSEDSKKRNSNTDFMPIKGQKRLWFVNCSGAFQSLAL